MLHSEIATDNYPKKKYFQEPWICRVNQGNINKNFKIPKFYREYFFGSGIRLLQDGRPHLRGRVSVHREVDSLLLQDQERISAQHEC
jgi:hypothetical protein